MFWKSCHKKSNGAIKILFGCLFWDLQDFFAIIFMWVGVISLPFSNMHARIFDTLTIHSFRYSPLFRLDFRSTIAKHVCLIHLLLPLRTTVSCSPLFRWHVAHLPPSVTHNCASSTAFRSSPHLSSSPTTHSLPPSALQALSPSSSRPPGRYCRGALICPTMLGLFSCRYEFLLQIQFLFLYHQHLILGPPIIFAPNRKPCSVCVWLMPGVYILQILWAPIHVNHTNVFPQSCRHIMWRQFIIVQFSLCIQLCFC